MQKLENSFPAGKKVDTATYYMKPGSFDANGDMKDGSFEMEPAIRKINPAGLKLMENGTASEAGARTNRLVQLRWK